MSINFYIHMHTRMISRQQLCGPAFIERKELKKMKACNLTEGYEFH